MRPLEVQKLDCRLRELAQLQINTENAPPPPKKTCLLVFGYTEVFWSRCSLGASILIIILKRNRSVKNKVTLKRIYVNDLLSQIVIWKKKKKKKKTFRGE